MDVYSRMFAVIQTLHFSRPVSDYWTEEERGAFAAWLAAHPESGDVIPGSGGCGKVRWARAGMGKRGGVRVIHYNQLQDGRIYLLLIYAKSAQDNIPASVLQKIKESL